MLELEGRGWVLGVPWETLLGGTFCLAWHETGHIEGAIDGLSGSWWRVHRQAAIRGSSENKAEPGEERLGLTLQLTQASWEEPGITQQSGNLGQRGRWAGAH